MRFNKSLHQKHFHGYTPHYLGCFYGDKLKLGGEEEFSHCYDFDAGVCDVEYWITDELNNLSEANENLLLSLLERNKSFDDMLKNDGWQIVEQFANLVGKETHDIWRLGNKNIYDALQLLTNEERIEFILSKIQIPIVKHCSIIDSYLFPDIVEGEQILKHHFHLDEDENKYDILNMVMCELSLYHLTLVNYTLTDDLLTGNLEVYHDCD